MQKDGLRSCVLATVGDTAVTTWDDSGEVKAEDGILPIDELERRAIVQALETLRGNVSLAAQRLGIGRATLYRKLARYGLMGRS